MTPMKSTLTKHNIATNTFVYFMVAIWSFSRPERLSLDGEILENYITPGAFLHLRPIGSSPRIYAVQFHIMVR